MPSCSKSKFLFAVGESLGAPVFAFTDQQVEREETGISTAEQQISQLWFAVLIIADNLTVEYSVRSR
jgi:hypothetical protein